MTNPDQFRAALSERATPEAVSYQDTYYDTPKGDLDRTDREFLLRTVEDSAGTQRHLLTFKALAIDAETGSNPAFETTVADRNAMQTIISQLGPAHGLEELRAALTELGISFQELTNELYTNTVRQSRR